MLVEPVTLARGTTGQVKYAYHTAARITGWVLTVHKETRAVTVAATVDTADAYFLTQTPLVLLLVTRRGVSRWPITRCQVIDRQFHADLGTLEKKGTRDYEHPYSTSGD
jgi:starvation-inducible outer membrane lipoprotein